MFLEMSQRRGRSPSTDMFAEHLKGNRCEAEDRRQRKQITQGRSFNEHVIMETAETITSNPGGSSRFEELHN